MSVFHFYHSLKRRNLCLKTKQKIAICQVPALNENNCNPKTEGKVVKVNRSKICQGNYVISKSAIFDPLPPLLVVFLLSKIGNF